MNTHSKSVHDAEKPFKYNVCDNSFALKQQLHSQANLSDHEKKKPFNCNICDITFSQKSFLNKHIGLIHEKNYQRKRHGHTGYIEVFMQGKCGRNTESTFDIK